MIRNTRTTWGSISRLFHWALGLVILCQIAYGYWMNHVAARPDRLFYRSIHADIGYLILLFMLLRLIWRAANPVPAPPPDSPLWERAAAKISHYGLYVLTIAVSLLGWAMSGAHTPDYASFFGLFRVPQFTSPDKAAAQFYEDWHIYMAYVLLALVGIHILAAIYHVMMRDDDVVSRMTSGEARERLNS